MDIFEADTEFKKNVGDGILKKIMDFVETFINGMDG